MASGITITPSLKTKDVTNLQPKDIDLELTSPGREEEMESWKEVFGIQERYKAKLCSRNDGKAWIQHIVEESANGDMTSDELLRMAMRAADRCPFDNVDFLKKPFLVACKAAKVF